MSRVRAYLSECLLWAVRKTQLEIPIPDAKTKVFELDGSLRVLKQRSCG